MKIMRVWLLSGILFCGIVCRQNSSQDLKSAAGPYLGQTPPGDTPGLFAPGLVSTGLDELNNVFSPDLKEFYFCVRQYPNLVSLFRMRLEKNGWTQPALLPFASRYGDIDVTLSPKGDRLFFCSRRPVREGDAPREDFDFWMSERQSTSWGEAVHLGEAVNSDHHDFFPMMTSSGNLYFSSQREGTGTNNIYRAAFINGQFGRAEKLGPAINTEHREYDPYVSPDESIMIFTSERPGGAGRADLYISFRREDGSWSQAVNMGGTINSLYAEFCAMISPDGKYLFFTSARRPSPSFPDTPADYKTFRENIDMPNNGSGDIYWVNAGFIARLRRHE